MTVDRHYLRRMFAVGFIVLGGYFLIEHVYHFGFEFYDIIGHEYLGLLLILVGILIAMRWKRGPYPGDDT